MSLSAYSWESSPLLTVTSTVAGVLALAVGIWAAFYARPRRALTYSARMRRPKEQDQKRVKDALHFQGDRDRAAIVSFVLHGNGRLDVPTSVFDNATPITVDAKLAPIRSKIGIANPHTVASRPGS